MGKNSGNLTSNNSSINLMYINFKEIIRARLQKKAIQMEKQTDEHPKLRKFQVGDKVLVQQPTKTVRGQKKNKNPFSKIAGK